MEVTKENFSRAFEILSSEIEAADFIAIDGEFSGLSTIKQWGCGYETLEEKYDRIRVGTGKMLLIQYGISLFTWKEDLNQYEAMPFTFYIFPRPYKRYGNDVKFTSQSSSIDFLAHQGFDFNKLFHKGISFMTPYAEEKAKAAIEKEMAQYLEKEQQQQQHISRPTDQPPGESKVFIPKDQREFINGIVEKVQNFMKNEDCQGLDLEPCTAFQRKLIYERLEELYPLGLYLESANNDNNEKFIRCHKTIAGYKKNQDEKYQKEMEMLEEALGFTKVMRLLKKSKKTIIGHNMLLDLFLTICNFFSEPPLNLRDFKESVTDLFPTIIDTKLISNSPPIRGVVSGTGLETLIQNIELECIPKVNVEISEKLREEKEYTNKYHQAGYDAYSTGLVFLSLSKCIHSMEDKEVEHIDLKSDLLDPFINRVYVMGLRDVISMDLSKDDVLPIRRNVFYVRFPVTWKNYDLKQLFEPYTELDFPINWINDESAFVTICNTSRYEDIFKGLVLKEDKTQSVYVLPYYHYANNKDPRKNRLPSTSNDGELPAKRQKVDSDVEDGEIDSDED